MTITTSDIKILASARMTDDADGGGPMSNVAVQDGIENNVFPDVSSIDRAFGRFQLRKVYAAVLASGTDTLLGANVIVADEPDDAAVSTFIFAAASLGERRSEALARLQQSHWVSSTASAGRWSTADGSVAACSRLQLLGGAGYPPAAGTVLFSVDGDGATLSPVLVTAVTEVLSGDGTFTLGFPSSTAGTRVFAVTYVGDLPATLHAARGVYHGMPAGAAPRLCGTMAVSGTLTTGATSCSVDSVLAPVAPWVIGSEPAGAETIGIDATSMPPVARAVLAHGGDAIVVHHTAETSPATATNGSTINCGRTALARAIVIGADGQAVAGGYTVNRTTGIVTCTDVSAWPQPVKARHTIEDVLGLARTGYPEQRSTATAGSGVSQTGPHVLSAGVSMYCGRPNVGRLRVYSKSGQDITTLVVSWGGASPGSLPAFALSLTAGTAQLMSSVNSDALAALTAFIGSHSPVLLVGSGAASTAAQTAPQANPNTLTFNRALARDFPAGTLVSTALLMGDLQARVGEAFAQESWTGAWQDSRLGNNIAAQFNQPTYPIVAENRGTVSERWAIIFTGATAFRVIGEALGQVATGNTSGDLAPVNPATGQPYFTLPALGWGTGWSAGNVLRFNTAGPSSPVWVSRVTMPSAPSDAVDSLTLAVRGDINT